MTNKNLIHDITNAAQQSWIRTVVFLNSSKLQSPLLFVFCCECGNRSYGQKALDLYYIQDAAIAQTFSMLAIEEEGLSSFLTPIINLGSCWVGGFDQEKVQSILKIPAHFRPVGIQVCGFRKSKSYDHKKVPQKSYSFCDFIVFFINFLMFTSLSRIACQRISPFAIVRSFAVVQDVNACSKAFDDIIQSRNSCRKYKKQDVDDTLLNHILSQTLVWYRVFYA